ncbi:MAG: hypothetical protein OSA99_21090, partial [Acidimicrobiales bacterium]|nr:hypothetical protein [Acidimicrobiales bacterium]
MPIERVGQVAGPRRRPERFLGDELAVGVGRVVDPSQRSGGGEVRLEQPRPLPSGDVGQGVGHRATGESPLDEPGEAVVADAVVEQFGDLDVEVVGAASD